MRIKSLWKTAIALAVVTASVGAFAGHDNGGERRFMQREEDHEMRQAVRQERMRDVRAAQSMPPQYQPQYPAQPQYQPQYQPQGQSFPQQYSQPGQSQVPAEAGRRNGRMSADERRALRRQIDQASRDMYGPGR